MYCTQTVKAVKMDTMAINLNFMTYVDFISPEFFSEAREALTNLYFTKEGILFNIGLGISMFFLSIITFKKRKLYLE